MRVLFVGSHRADRQFSIVGFEQVLERELAGLCEFEVIRPGKESPLASVSKYARYVDKFVLFPRLLRERKKGCDIVHFCESGMALNLPNIKTKPSLVTMHDFMAIKSATDPNPVWQTGWRGKQFQRMILQAVRQAAGIACVSESTRQDMQSILYGYRGQERTIINSTYKNYKKISEQEALSRLGTNFVAKPGKFYFHIGGNKHYKNRLGVLQIYAEILKRNPGSDIDLVMAGSGKTPILSQAEIDLNLLGRIHWVKEPNDDQVEALYSLAMALIFPSKCEGFGLPIVEAQLCGCPVFATNKRPMTEVGANSAVYFDCNDPVDGATQVLAHTDNLDELRKLGFINCIRFDPKTMAQSYLDFYKELLEIGAKSPQS